MSNLLEVTPTQIPDVVILKARRFGDDRGFFSEPWNRARMREVGLSMDFVQDNHSFSAIKGTVRGLHYQAPPFAQDKLVRVTRGAVMDVAVDARKGSPTFGKWVGVELSAENGLALLVPKGFLHGFATLTPDVDFSYKCTDYYNPECEGSVYFADPDLGIDWGVEADLDALSGKDRADQASSWAAFDSPFTY